MTSALYRGAHAIPRPPAPNIEKEEMHISNERLEKIWEIAKANAEANTPDVKEKIKWSEVADITEELILQRRVRVAENEEAASK